jgi:hypothetical protein
LIGLGPSCPAHAGGKFWPNHGNRFFPSRHLNKRVAGSDTEERPPAGTAGGGGWPPQSTIGLCFQLLTGWRRIDIRGTFV